MNLEQIIPIHEELLNGLEDALKVYDQYTAKVSAPLLDFAPNIKAPYYRFCLEYKKSIQIMRLLRISNTEFNNHMANLQKEGVTKF